jgi:hypothetical protein
MKNVANDRLYWAKSGWLITGFVFEYIYGYRWANLTRSLKDPMILEVS